MPEVEVVRTHLEMRTPGALRGDASPDPRAVVRHLPAVTVDEYRALYHAVGHRYHWHDRDAWTDEQLLAHLSLRSVAVWRLEYDGTAAGFFELKHHYDGSVEIVYFGLVDGFTGRGLGRLLLRRAVEEAWNLGASRVWLHTCTLDNEAALPNYLARGFSPFRRETYRTTI